MNELIDNKERIIGTAVNKALSGDSRILEMLVKRLIPERANESIIAKSTKDVTKALADGKVSPTEALQLMKMLQSRTEQELAPKLLAEMQRLK